VDEAIENFQKAAELNPADASIFNNLGVLHFSKEFLEEAEASFRKAVGIEPHYADALYGLGKVYQKYADAGEPQKLEQHIHEVKSRIEILYEQNKVQEAWKISRRLVELSPDDAENQNDYAVLCHELDKMEEAREAISKAQKLATEDADIQENHQALYSNNRGDRRREVSSSTQKEVTSNEQLKKPEIIKKKTEIKQSNIFLACMPESGSTYLRTILSEITGFPRMSAVQFYGHNEQDIFELVLRHMKQFNSVTQQHVKGTDNNIMLMKKYNIKPVITLRNIFDVVLSVYDHIEREDHRGPSGYIHKEYFRMSKEEKLDYLIRIHFPWFFSFYMSWREASEKMDVLWTSYEELFSDQIGTISRVLSFYSLPVCHDKIESAMSVMRDRNTRFNVGISGRGEKLQETHRKALLDLARVWKMDGKEMEMIGVKL